MLTITDFKIAESKQGKEFVSLTLTGGVEFIQSQETGNFYLKGMKCRIPSTLDETSAKALLGTQVPGRIERVGCDSYEYTIKETGEVITLAHTYVYLPEITSVLVPNEVEEEYAINEMDA
ncbi:MAG: hypothetical protein Q8L07_08015 [Sediminibacterium sp.]|nr:hypothetical protein [Sediminibacterium sp.]